jgi:hypothetical protein
LVLTISCNARALKLKEEEYTMKSGKLILASLGAALLMSAAAVPSFAQQADGNKMPGQMAGQMPGPRGPESVFFKMFDTNSDGKITREEENTEKAKLFAEIDKNGDKKLSYDEVKAWAQEVMSKMPTPPAPGDVQNADAGAPPPPPADDQAAGKPGAQPPADGKQPPPPPPGAGPDAGPAAGQGPEGGPEGGPMDGPGMRHHEHHGDHMHEGMMGPMGPREHLAMMFLRADANDDGFISEEEFNVALDQMFTHADHNGDGVVDMRDMPRPGPHHGPKDGPKGHGPKEDMKKKG